MTEAPDRGTDGDDSVPVSVRLGTVVPPEDPEDWTRPLTWVAALGMLAGPLATLAWFWLARPADASVVPGTWLAAASLVVGAVLTGATQSAAPAAFAGTLGAGLFASLATVIVGLVLAGERQLQSASPTLAQAFVVAVAGSSGALAAAVVGPALAALHSRLRRIAIASAIGIAVAFVVVRQLGSA